MIYLGSDHGGFEIKEQIKSYLVTRGLPFLDLGAQEFVDGDDYPEYATAVAEAVAEHPSKDVGILACRSGQGVCITANKIKGIRAAVVWNTQAAAASRNDDFANVLCLPSDYVTATAAQDIVRAFLETEWSQDARHIRRIKKITQLEARVNTHFK